MKRTCWTTVSRAPPAARAPSGSAAVIATRSVRAESSGGQSLEERGGGVNTGRPLDCRPPPHAPVGKTRRAPLASVFVDRVCSELVPPLLLRLAQAALAARRRRAVRWPDPPRARLACLPLPRRFTAAMSEEELKLSTAPTSKRFPTTNQAKACYMYYNSWHQCKYDYSDDEPQCAKLKHWARAMCPDEWVCSSFLPRSGLLVRIHLSLLARRSAPRRERTHRGGGSSSVDASESRRPTPLFRSTDPTSPLTPSALVPCVCVCVCVCVANPSCFLLARRSRNGRRSGHRAPIPVRSRARPRAAATESAGLALRLERRRAAAAERRVLF